MHLCHRHDELTGPRTSRSIELLLCATLMIPATGWRGDDPTTRGQQSTETRTTQEIAALLASQGQAVVLPAPKGKIKRSIQRTDAEYPFQSGDSRALLFQLSSSAAPATVTIVSFCNCGGPSKSVLVPRITLHDGDFNQTAEISEDNLNGQSGALMAKLAVDPASHRYLLLFTRGDLVNKELGTLRTFQGLLMKISYPYFRAAFGTVELTVAPPSNK